ncbi:MAG: LysM peptidoglycan-binding domain-containing protein [Chloroflexi bacterium]|nr:LysM peptidoglycan-binding domain-containing protein [Chloroflexota bacterium]
MARTYLGKILRADAFRRGNLLIVALLFFGLTACTPNADVEPTRTPILAGSLQAYLSPTPSSTPLPATPAPTQTPLPTATPHLYQVSSGDTMGSIALKFGITTNDLIAANPDVQPSAMSVGQELLIPDGEEKALTASTLVPLAIEISAPNCYPTLSGGVWCFVSAENKTGASVENISAEIKAFDYSGNLLAQKNAFPLIDRLLADEAISLLVFFPDLSADIRTESRLITAFPVADEESRYLSASLQNVLTEIAWDGRSAEISGNVLVEGDASQIWVVATAYDAMGNIVGVRRWESLSGEKDVDLTLASLGHEIENIQLNIEAKK